MSSTATPPKVEFVQFHRPALLSGTYHLGMEQTIRSHSDKIPPGESYAQKLTFAVLGERFSINPQEIHMVFPPSGSLGDHFMVLPHISFNRSTLPWERKADAKDPDDEAAPWLVLLLFTEEEAPEPSVQKVQDLKLDLPLEIGQHEDDKVTVIDVPRSVLEPMMPAKSELKMMTHVRRGILFGLDKGLQADLDKGQLPTDLRDAFAIHHATLSPQTSVSVEKRGHKWLLTENDTKKTYTIERDDTQLNVYEGEQYEFAVIIGNRLPKKGALSTVHVVSVEHRYQGEHFDYQGAETIRLVSLKSWQFSCRDEKQSFTALLEHLNRTPTTLRLPPNDHARAEAHLATGQVPLPHTMRRSNKTVSWYRGPLIPGENPDQVTLPVRAADALLRYDPDNGLFDVSYAAAWEMGRLLTLQSKRISIGLFNWKRSMVLKLKQAEQQVLHLPIQAKSITGVDAPPEPVSTWFRALSLLEGLPFQYLVPDERQLPEESIRFFRVDNLWVDCLLDGAFSIGRTTALDHDRDGTVLGANQPRALDELSGFLLRSDVVSGWPGLLVDGYRDVILGRDFVPAKEKLPLVRMERLSANVLLCLFAGTVKTVDIHLKPETLHFGMDVRPDSAHEGLYKTLRNPDGSPAAEGQSIPEIPWWKEPAKHIVDISALVSDIEGKLGNIKLTSAQFALQMVVGVQAVRFMMQEA